MTGLLLVRHGVTGWNTARRLQGRRDIPLSAAGRAQTAGWLLPAEFAGFAWLSSPLARATETAGLLGAPPPVATDPRLMEMAYGDWEGRRLADLRAELGEVMVQNEARGLDFRPPGGESPRDVQARLRPLFIEIAGRGRPIVAVCHVGIVRATLALALGWDMTGKPPVKLRRAVCHHFTLAADGRPSLVAANIPLGERLPAALDQPA